MAPNLTEVVSLATCLSLIALNLISVHTAVASGSAQTDPVIASPHGAVRGRRVLVHNVAVDIFMGVPFARAERWREPRPLPQPAWKGEKDTTKPPPSCPQILSKKLEGALQQQGRPLATSEDCLFLNVYTPTPKNGDELSTRRRPVMVWIHGGSFIHGMGSIYDGEALAASGDVVVVTINYRLGVFGFLQLAPGQTANFGLLDQLAALDWVKHHIKWYGGDERKVTIFGESAGGASVGWLLLSAKTPVGLFKRAIMQSGTPNSDWAWRSSERALADTSRLARILHCDISSEIKMELCLRKQNTADILAAQFKLVDYSQWSVPPLELLYASPIVDGVVISDSPEALMQSKHSLPVQEVIVGFTQTEMAYFFLRLDSLAKKATAGFNRKEFELFLGERVLLSGPNPVVNDSSSSRQHLSKESLSTAKTFIEYAYAGGLEEDDAKKLRDLMLVVWSDSAFACPSLAMVQYLAKKNVTVFAYLFTRSDGRLPAWTNSTHTEDLDYVFGAPLLGRSIVPYGHVPGFAFSEKDISFSKLLVELWSSFAQTGKPMTTQETPVESWPAYTTTRPRYLQLDELKNVRVLHNVRRQQCQFWLHQFPQLLKAVSLSSLSAAGKTLSQAATKEDTCPSLSCTADSTMAQGNSAKSRTGCQSELSPAEHVVLFLFFSVAFLWLVCVLVSQRT